MDQGSIVETAPTLAGASADHRLAVTPATLSTVHLSVVTPTGERARSLTTTGTPETVRQRIAPVVMHLLRRALTDSN